MGQTQATKEAVWLILLLHKLNTPSSTNLPSQNRKATPIIPGLYLVIIYCNNQGAIALLKNLQAYAESKDIDIQ